MNSVMVPKNTPMRRHVTTFLSSVASGSDNPTMPIMKAMTVPIGIFGHEDFDDGHNTRSAAIEGSKRRIFSGKKEIIISNH